MLMRCLHIPRNGPFGCEEGLCAFVAIIIIIRVEFELGRIIIRFIRREILRDRSNKAISILHDDDDHTRTTSDDTPRR